MSYMGLRCAHRRRLKRTLMYWSRFSFMALFKRLTDDDIPRKHLSAQSQGQPLKAVRIYPSAWIERISMLKVCSLALQRERIFLMGFIERSSVLYSTARCTVARA